MPSWTRLLSILCLLLHILRTKERPLHWSDSETPDRVPQDIKIRNIKFVLSMLHRVFSLPSNHLCNLMVTEQPTQSDCSLSNSTSCIPLSESSMVEPLTNITNRSIIIRFVLWRSLASEVSLTDRSTRKAAQIALLFSYACDGERTYQRRVPFFSAYACDHGRGRTHKQGLGANRSHNYKRKSQTRLLGQGCPNAPSLADQLVVQQRIGPNSSIPVY